MKWFLLVWVLNTGVIALPMDSETSCQVAKQQMVAQNLRAECIKQ